MRLRRPRIFPEVQQVRCGSHDVKPLCSAVPLGDQVNDPAMAAGPAPRRPPPETALATTSKRPHRVRHLTLVAASLSTETLLPVVANPICLSLGFLPTGL